MPKSHTDKEFEAQLADLRQRLQRMGLRVGEMLAHAVDALADGDEEKASATIAADRVVDRMEKEIDELSMLVLARWQPVASDLRFLTAALKVVTDLERIGDLSVNICERAIDIGARLSEWNSGKLQHMADKVRSMVRDATEAFIALDIDKARDVIARDDEVDDLYTEIFREVLAGMKRAPTSVRDGIHILSVVKWLERMADHATNLAEHTIFLSEGTDIRHQNKLPSTT